MALLEKDHFDEWMVRLMHRLDRQDKVLERLKKPVATLDNDALLDNQDLCQLLQVSKRTLQRYRSSHTLLYHRIGNKTLYKDSDVQNFIIHHFEKFEAKRAAELKLKLYGIK